jgi:hypothetical protein
MVDVRQVMVDVRRVMVDVRRVMVVVRRVMLDVKRVMLDVRRVMLDVRRVSLDERRLSLKVLLKVRHDIGKSHGVERDSLDVILRSCPVRRGAIVVALISSDVTGPPTQTFRIMPRGKVIEASS